MQAQRKRKSSLPPPAPKKRKNASQLEEITFDNTARAEYLTGFHKRKVARIKSAQDEAAKKAKAELIVARKRIRETRKQELQEHVDSVNAMITAIIPGASKDTASSDDDEWEGIPNDTNDDIDHNEEYIDEDKYTTVTVTTMNDDDNSSEDEDDPKVKARKARESIYNEDGTKKDLRNSGDKERTKEKKPKVKKKKFRYLSKGERREDQRKQKGIRSKKAYERKGTEKEKEKDKGKGKSKGKR